jgi:regulator of protease activity HflC (stomatin/prohibitin superfamily)
VKETDALSTRISTLWRPVLALIVVLLLIISVMNSWYTIDEKERGVVLRNGAFVDIAEPGLGFKVPWIDSVKIISVQNQTTTYKNVQAYSRDQQTASMSISVSWHVSPDDVEQVYKQFGSEDALVTRLISRQVGTQAERIFGGYTAVRAVQERGQLGLDYAKAFTDAISGPVVIDSVQLENIDFSDAYERSIEERMKAEVAVKTREQDLARERVNAEIAVTQAQAAADSSLARARAEAEATRLRGEAEADAIKARADALKANQALVELTKAERWDGKLPSTVLPNSAVPFIDARTGSRD